MFGCFFNQIKKIFYIDSLGENNSFVSKIGILDFARSLKNTLKIESELDYCYVPTQEQVLNECGTLVCSYAEIILSFGLENLFDERVCYDHSCIRKARLHHSNLIDIAYFVPKISLVRKSSKEKNIFDPPLRRSTPSVSRKRPSEVSLDVKSKRSLFK